jgi:WD40 repeat protein
VRRGRFFFTGIGLLSGLAGAAWGDDASTSPPEFHESPQTIATCPWDITGVVALPDQQSICTGHSDGSIVVWSLMPSQPLRRIVGHTSGVTALDVDSAGNLLSASEDGTLRIWDVETGECRIQFSGGGNWLICCAFSSDGQWVAGGGYDGNLFLWRREEPSAPFRILEHGGAPVTAVAFSQDGRLLATGTQDGRVRLWTWSANGPSETPSIAEPVQGSARSLAFLEDGSQLIIGYETGITLMRSIDWGESGAALGAERSVDSSAPVNVVCVLASNPVIASATVSGELCVWSLSPDPDVRAVRTVLSGHRGPVTGIALLTTETGNWLVSVGEDRTIQLWRTKLPATPALATVSVPESRLWAIAVSEESNHFAVGGRGGYLAIHDLKSGERLYVVEGFEETVDSLSFSSDGTKLALSSWKAPLVGIVDVAAGALTQTLTIDPTGDLDDNGRQVHFTRDNQSVLVACEKQGLQRLDFNDARQAVAVSSLSTYAVDVSPDGQTIAAGGGDWQREAPGTLKLFNASDLSEIATLAGHEHAVRWVAFHPHEPLLASADEQGIVIIWDLATRGIVHRLVNPDGCKPVAFSPDGSLLAVGLKDGSIQIWNWRTDELLQRMVTEDDVFDLVFSPDGTAIIAVNGERLIHVFPVTKSVESTTAQDAANWTPAQENAE